MSLPWPLRRLLLKDFNYLPALIVISQDMALIHRTPATIYVPALFIRIWVRMLPLLASKLVERVVCSRNCFSQLNVVVSSKSRGSDEVPLGSGVIYSEELYFRFGMHNLFGGTLGIRILPCRGRGYILKTHFENDY